MQVQSTPAAGAGPDCETEHSDQHSVLQSVETVVVGAVSLRIPSDVLVGKYNEGVKEYPPAQQHQKIQHAEMDSAFLLDQVGTPGHCGNHGQGMKEQDDIEQEWIGD